MQKEDSRVLWFSMGRLVGRKVLRLAELIVGVCQNEFGGYLHTIMVPTLLHNVTTIIDLFLSLDR